MKGTTSIDLSPVRQAISDHEVCNLITRLTAELAAPPEQYEEGEGTSAVDVSAFALILYELLFGRPVLVHSFDPIQSNV
jgi:serine/threonine protein kinase